MSYPTAVLTFDPGQLRGLIEKGGLEIDQALAVWLKEGKFPDTQGRNALCCALLKQGINYRRIAGCFIPPVSPGLISGMPSFSGHPLKRKPTSGEEYSSRVRWLNTTEAGRKEVARVMGEAARDKRFWGTRLYKVQVLRALGVSPAYSPWRTHIWRELGLEDLKVEIVVKYGLGLDPRELFADPELSHFSSADWAAFINYLGREKHLLRIDQQIIEQFRTLLRRR